MVVVRIFELFAIFFVAAAHIEVHNYAEKQGSCPPPFTTDSCALSCSADANCPGTMKCCTTSCGDTAGTVCSNPVTTSQHESIRKPGSCPEVPTGRWVCSSTCSSDGDCRGSRKCCKNRCGALACQIPESNADSDSS